MYGVHQFVRGSDELSRSQLEGFTGCLNLNSVSITWDQHNFNVTQTRTRLSTVVVSKAYSKMSCLANARWSSDVRRPADIRAQSRKTSLVSLSTCMFRHVGSCSRGSELVGVKMQIVAEYSQIWFDRAQTLNARHWVLMLTALLNKPRERVNKEWGDRLICRRLLNVPLQRGPPKSLMQTHTYRPSSLSKQLPPFRHGFEWQGLSKTQSPQHARRTCSCL